MNAAWLFQPFRSPIFRIAVFSLLGTVLLFPLVDWLMSEDIPISDYDQTALLDRAGAFPETLQFEDENFRPILVVPGPLPAIIDVPVRSSQDATGLVEDDELVLGVQVGGEARAYPINALTGPSREIVNDELGGRAIAATW